MTNVKEVCQEILASPLAYLLILKNKGERGTLAHELLLLRYFHHLEHKEIACHKTHESTISLNQKK
ncbi:MAG: hypothetical protein NVSMB49_26990 [Ktedonobacteraceae bacterium]